MLLGDHPEGEDLVPPLITISTRALLPRIPRWGKAGIQMEQYLSGLSALLWAQEALHGSGPRHSQVW